MARVRLLLSFALVTGLSGLSVNCSSSDGGGPEADAGDDASTDAPSPGDGGDDALSGDHVAPTFGGILTAVATDESKVAVAWDPASDDVSPAGRIAYRVYASSPGGTTVDFSVPVA